MSVQYLRNSGGKLLGTIKTLSDGKFELRSASGKFLGTYDPKTDVTRDSAGRNIGKGNLLGTLLPG